MHDLWDLVVDPLRPAYLQRALLEVLVLSVPAGLLGAWVVLRRMAFLTHAIGHATFPALVIAYVAGWSVFGAALVAALALALGLGALGRRPELEGGVAVAVVLSAALALGAVLVSDLVDVGVGADTLLFGSLLAVGDAEVARSVAVAVPALAASILVGRPWLLIAFDRPSARVSGLPSGVLDALLLALLGAAVSVAIAVVGSLMVSGLFLVPAATARLLTRRLASLQALAVAIAAVEGAAGLWLAARADAPPGAAIAAVAAGVFVVVAVGQAAIGTGPRVALGSGVN